jgi:biotin operon repressor
MIQPDLLSWTPPAPQSILGDRHGVTFDHKSDVKRLNKQAQAVWEAMADGRYYSLRELADKTGYPEASISARIRDFRKAEFGGRFETVETVPVHRGLFRYKLHPEKRAA